MTFFPKVQNKEYSVYCVLLGTEEREPSVANIFINLTIFELSHSLQRNVQGRGHHKYYCFFKSE